MNHSKETVEGAKAKVLAVYPFALARSHGATHWVIYDHPDPHDRTPISVQYLSSKDEAWLDAVSRLKDTSEAPTEIHDPETGTTRYLPAAPTVDTRGEEVGKVEHQKVLRNGAGACTCGWPFDEVAKRWNQVEDHIRQATCTHTLTTKVSATTFCSKHCGFISESLAPPQTVQGQGEVGLPSLDITEADKVAAATYIEKYFAAPQGPSMDSAVLKRIVRERQILEALKENARLVESRSKFMRIVGESFSYLSMNQPLASPELPTCVLDMVNRAETAEAKVSELTAQVEGWKTLLKEVYVVMAGKEGCNPPFDAERWSKCVLRVEEALQRENLG